MNLTRKNILTPQKNNKWMSEMVLNPAIIYDESTSRIHMLFRASGEWPEKRLNGKPMPYPICLGYGYSDDNGETWIFDYDKPALFPELSYDTDKIHIKNSLGDTVVNYSNGGMEDPRLFRIDNKVYLTVACRMFPPGPYWKNDDPIQCVPDWVFTDQNQYGEAAKNNYTVNVLYQVDLTKLSERNYKNAFAYITALTNPKYGEDRDVMFFSERTDIDGKLKLVMLQRPFVPSNYKNLNEDKPSVVISYADKFEDFFNDNCSREILMKPELWWEKDRIGASAPPMKISENKWLLCYHGKCDSKIGYTQSFAIVEKNDDKFIVSRKLGERLITVQEEWEKSNKFKTPCIFVTGMIKANENLILSYGAADEKIGIIQMNYRELINSI